MAFAPLKRYIAMSGGPWVPFVCKDVFGDKSWGNRINTHTHRHLRIVTKAWIFNSLFCISKPHTHKVCGMLDISNYCISFLALPCPSPVKDHNKKSLQQHAVTPKNNLLYLTGFFVVFSSWTSLKVDPRGAIYWVSGGHVHASSSALKPPNLFERLVWGLGLGTALGEAAWFWWQKCEDILRTGKTACNIT